VAVDVVPELLVEALRGGERHTPDARHRPKG
jgi:hypothetical protein